MKISKGKLKSGKSSYLPRLVLWGGCAFVFFLRSSWSIPLHDEVIALLDFFGINAIDG